MRRMEEPGGGERGGDADVGSAVAAETAGEGASTLKLRGRACRECRGACAGSDGADVSELSIRQQFRPVIADEPHFWIIPRQQACCADAVRQENAGSAVQRTTTANSKSAFFLPVCMVDDRLCRIRIASPSQNPL